MAFRALRIIETSAGKFERSIKELDLEDLPPGELLVRVNYSSLNYKDALSATGNKGITKKYPHTPGIDAAGVVELSRSPKFAVNEEVIVTGHDLGMNTSGGFAEYFSARKRAVRVLCASPGNLPSSRNSMTPSSSPAKP